MIIIEKAGVNSKTGKNDVNDDDEIKNYLDCRYLSACEATWRIFQFDIHGRFPSVMCLQVHLQHQHSITLSDTSKLEQFAAREDLKETTFTEWMKMNSIDEVARQLTYAEFPTQFVWNDSVRVWDEAKGQWIQRKEWNRRKKGTSIGRIYYVHPTAGEKYYLRLLLNFVRGPTSFADIRTINGVTYPTYKDTYYALGLLNDHKEWNEAMAEASQWAVVSQLREFFCHYSTIL